MTDGYQMCHTTDCINLAWWKLLKISKLQPTKEELKPQKRYGRLTNEQEKELLAPQRVYLCRNCYRAYIQGLNTKELITFEEI